MKKKYEKPGLYIENFALSQTIAAGGCGVRQPGSSLGDTTHLSKETCGWDSGSGVFWLETTESCSDKLGAEDEIFGFCYNNPNGGTTIFSFS